LPATPGIIGNNVPPPATPGVPGGFGPHSNAVPATPGLSGMPPPQTPAFPAGKTGGGAGIPLPQTPGVLQAAGGGNAKKKNVPAPATPANLEVAAAASAGGSPSKARRGVVPAPQTPGIFATRPAVGSTSAGTSAGGSSSSSATSKRRSLPAPATPAGLEFGAVSKPDEPAAKRQRTSSATARREALVIEMPVEDGKGGTRMERKSFQRCLTFRDLQPEAFAPAGGAKSAGGKIARPPPEIAAVAPSTPPRR